LCRKAAFLVLSGRLGQYEDKDWTSDQKTYAAMVTYLDNSVGKIRKYLIDNGLDKNTIVIFTSDNGPRSEPAKSLTAVADFFKSSGPLKGYKRDMNEGGIREPFIVWGNSLIKPGTTSATPGYFADMMATLGGIAGAKAAFRTDGINLFPYILNPQARPKDRFLYWEFFEGGYIQAVRYGKWKAIIKDRQLSLYNLETDIHEDSNIADAHPDIVARVKDYLRVCRTESPYWPIR
jgi:arylsulfatase A-like enzyme